MRENDKIIIKAQITNDLGKEDDESVIIDVSLRCSVRRNVEMV